MFIKYQEGYERNKSEWYFWRVFVDKVKSVAWIIHFFVVHVVVYVVVVRFFVDVDDNKLNVKFTD